MAIDYDIYMTRLFEKAGNMRLPLAGSFELTPRCTLNCKMCYIHSSETNKTALTLEKSTDWWLTLAENAKREGMLLLLLTGGEPLIRPDFEELYRSCRSMGLLMSVNTNGTLIDREKVEFFKENPPRRLNITLYGTSPQTYGRLCGSEEAFHKVIFAITELKNAGISLKLNYSVTTLNVGDCEKAQELARALGLPIQPVTYMFPPVRGGDGGCRLTPREASAAQLSWRRRLLGEEGFRDYTRLLRIKGAMPQSDGCPDTPGERISCRAGSSSFWVTYDGEMRLCGMMNKGVKADSFSTAWQELGEMRKRIFLPKKCLTCKNRGFCDICAAVAMAETGGSGEPPPYACKKTQEYVKLLTNL